MLMVFLTLVIVGTLVKMKQGSWEEELYSMLPTEMPTVEELSIVCE